MSTEGTRLEVLMGWGLRTPNFGEGEALWGQDGTVRKSVGEFIVAVHSNFSYLYAFQR